jgi:hypothetical protein
MPSHADVVKAATSLQPMLAKIDHATTLSTVIFAALCFARSLAVMMVENELARRAFLPTLWPRCRTVVLEFRAKVFGPARC